MAEPLADDVNYLAFKNVEELATAVERALAMDVGEVERMRRSFQFAFDPRCVCCPQLNFRHFAGVPATEDSLHHCWMRLFGGYESYLNPCVRDAVQK
jgi:hypothetical protein